MKRPLFYAMDTPLGEIFIHARDGIPVGIMLTGEAGSYKPADSSPPPVVVELMRAIDGYFQGKDICPDIAENLIADLDETPFKKPVLREVMRIPRGEIRSYGDIAQFVGYPRAARAVGNAMRSNPFPIIIPCHRVIRGDGGLGGYGGMEHLKARLLRFEGVTLMVNT